MRYAPVFLASTDFSMLLAVLIVVIAPIVCDLIIARFRGFFASLFFLPTAYGALTFATEKFDLVKKIADKGGTFNENLSAVIEESNKVFLRFHNSLIDPILNLCNLTDGTIYNVIKSGYFYFAVYLVLFLLLYIFVHKRKHKSLD